MGKCYTAQHYTHTNAACRPAGYTDNVFPEAERFPAGPQAISTKRVMGRLHQH